RTDEPEDLAGCDVEVDVAEHLERAEAMPEVAHADRARHGSPPKPTTRTSMRWDSTRMPESFGVLSPSTTSARTTGTPAGNQSTSSGVTASIAAHAAAVSASPGPSAYGSEFPASGCTARRPAKFVR